MAQFDNRLSGYVDVATRIAEFRVKHPEGSLQPADLAQPFRVEKFGDETFVVVVAAAYRGPDDSRPGIGMAAEPYPGRTPYTRGSELMNAETSAWGRAIVAALAADTRQGVASADEIRNRRDTPLGRLNVLFGQSGISTREERTAYANRVLGREIASAGELSPDEIAQLADALEHGLAEPNHEETTRESE